MHLFGGMSSYHFQETAEWVEKNFPRHIIFLHAKPVYESHMNAQAWS